MASKTLWFLFYTRFMIIHNDISSVITLNKQFLQIIHFRTTFSEIKITKKYMQILLVNSVTYLHKYYVYRPTQN